MGDRHAARVAGALFIAATVPFSISVGVLAPVLESPDFLAAVAGHPARVSAGILLELTNHVAVVGIAVVLYPILRRDSERLALGYVVARSIEGALFAVGTTNLISLKALSDRVGATNPSGAEALSSTLLAAHDWNQVTLPFVAFALGTLLLNYHLFRRKLVPRWISGWGFIAGASILLARVLLLGGAPLTSPIVTAMDAPIFAQEMVFAVWLIVRGFAEPTEREAT
ncbi:MAG: hypothetical protein AMS21_04430 [Gemmatimonas sp. SG8_38_2]|jgi:hypothetical protein|nr:MAG: hypothetical protein AMS21_04430 [Gemmatimonas sp. SG8_38_2]